MARNGSKALIALCALLLAACGSEVVAPTTTVPDGKTLIATFTGEVDEATGAFTIRSYAPAGTPVGAPALATPPEITAISISNVTPASTGPICPGSAQGRGTEVLIKANPFDAANIFTDVYAQIETVTATGSAGCNSATPPLGSGLSNTLGLWYYPHLGDPNGASTLWAFNAPTSGRFTFSGKVYGTVMPVKVVFVTSTSYYGSLGGATGADDKCQARANAGIALNKLPAGSTYKAFVSSVDGNAAAIVPDAAFVRPDGTIVAISKNDLLGGTIRAAINVTEFDTGPVTTSVWTGSFENGTTASGNCADWTSSTLYDYGFYGLSNATDFNWAFTDNFVPCNNIFALYCVQQ